MKKQPKISSLIDKAVFDYNLIEKNDRILIGASGGKDSTALVEYFANRAKRPDCGFEYLALNVQSDFAPLFPAGIKELFERWQVPFKSIDVNILERVKKGQKMSCWWCSTQRRTELINYAIANGYNKIALGHHLEDILETFLMNMLDKAEISTMSPRLEYKNYPVTLIRPLCYVPEERLVEHAKKNGYAGFTCTCNYQENSARKDARKKLEMLTDSSLVKKYHMQNSLKNIKNLYLMNPEIAFKDSNTDSL